jgi:hypothetical protein
MFLAVILSCSAYGDLYYVTVDGNDNDPGTEGMPFKTIQRAADVAQPGDIVDVGPGLYRETVMIRSSGTPNSPIIFRTDPVRRAVITGAEVVTEWQTLDVNENTYSAEVPDIATLPDWIRRRFLREDGRILTTARLPKDGWWLTEDAGESTLVDTIHLALFAKAEDLAGVEVHYMNTHSSIDVIRVVTAYDPMAKQLTFDDTVDYPSPDKDYYYVRNKLNLLTEPGEWVLDTNGPAPRICVRPSDDGQADDHTYEYSQRDPVINLNGNSHITIQGFEIRDSLLLGIRGGGPVDGFKLLNCHIAGNAYMGAHLEGSDMGHRRQFHPRPRDVGTS